LKVWPRENCGKFLEFLAKGLNSFKIQASFKLELFLGFIMQNPEEFVCWAKQEICSVCIYLPLCKVWEFLDLSKMVFTIFEVESFEVNWKI
jgi:hypothetical protein